jgi:hypothetical protein
VAKCAAYAAAAVIAVVLSACSGSGSTSHRQQISQAVIRHFEGFPPGVSFRHFPPTGPNDVPHVAWAGPQSIYVMIFGSDDCPSVPGSVVATGPSRLAIRTIGVQSGGSYCGDHPMLATSVVRLPVAVEHARTLVVDVDGKSTRLAARTDVCGPWSSPDSIQALAIRQTRGRLTSCALVGRTWMVTAVRKTRPGEIGLLTCGAAEPACVEGDEPHDLTTFTWIPAPVGPGLNPYGGSGPAGPIFIFTTQRDRQVKFDLRSRAFATCPHGVCTW